MTSNPQSSTPSPQPMTAVLEDKIIYNDRYTEFIFELKKPPTFRFLAGQYVSLKVSNDGTRRVYSIASPPSYNHGFRLLVDLSPGGIGTNFLKNLSFGQEVEVLGPLGNFVLDDSGKEEALVFVGTGSGIAPLRSMIEDRLIDQKDKRPMRLYWGMRHETELFWLEDIENWVEDYDNFQFYPVISRPQSDWPLSTGHVTDLVVAHHFLPNTGFYLCGNQQMIEDVSQVLVNQKQVDPSFIHFEKYY